MPHPTHYKGVVNLSEGCTPHQGKGSRRSLCKNQKTNDKPQYTHPLQVVNLSEGWALAGRWQRAHPLQVVNLSEGCSPKQCVLEEDFGSDGDQDDSADSVHIELELPAKMCTNIHSCKT